MSYMGSYLGGMVPPKKEEQMDKRTIEAIHKSIAHWNDICYGMEDDVSSEKCSLCREYNRSGRCTGCPLAIKNCCFNRQSPYTTYHGARKDYCTASSAEAAEAMLETLVGLLPDEEADRYDVDIIRVDSISEYTSNLCLWGRSGYNGKMTSGYIWHGITTDGRNRFPQADEVWRKVFERQDYNKRLFCNSCGQQIKARKRRVRYSFVSVEGYATMEEFLTRNQGMGIEFAEWADKE